MAVKFSNNAKTLLSSGITSTATSIAVDDASSWPQLYSGDYSLATIVDINDNTILEIVKVTAISNNILTVVRAQEGTSARAFDSGNRVELRVTAGLLEQALTGTDVVKLDSITATTTDAYSLAVGGVAYSPSNANALIVSLNGVTQEPNSAFTVSGSTITFSSALTANDSIDYIVDMAKTLDIGEPSDNTVTPDKLTSAVNLDAITDNGNTTTNQIGIKNAGSTLTASLSVDGTNGTEAIRVGSSTGGGGATQGESYIGLTAFSAGTNQTYPHAWIGVEEFDAADSRGSLILGTRQSDSDVAPTTVMTLDASGNTFISGDLAVDTDTLYVDSTNNRVGIGKGNPSTALDVSGDTTFKKAGGTVLILENSTSGVYVGDGTELQGAIYFKNNDSSGDGDHIGAKIESYVSDVIGRSNLEFYTGRSDTDLEKRMVIDHFGKVGIGTDDPATLLEVNDSSGNPVVNIEGFTDPAVRFTNTGNATTWSIGADTNPNVFSIAQSVGLGGTPRLVIDTSGSVGIGEPNPDAELHISSASPDLILEDTDSSSAIGSSNRLRFRNSTGTYSAQIGNDPSIDSGQNFTLGTLVNYPVGIMTNGSTRMTIDSDGKTTITSAVNESLVIKREGAGSNPYLSFKDGSGTLQSYIQSQGSDGDFTFVNSMDDGRFQFSITGGVGDGSRFNRFDFQGASAPEGDYPTTIKLYDQAQGSGWAAGDLFAAIEMDSVDGSGGYTDARGRIAMAMETTTGGGHSMRLQVADIADGTLKNFMSANHAGEVSFYNSGTEALKIEDGGEIKIKNFEPTLTLFDTNNGNGGGTRAHIRFESNDGNATTYIGVPQSTTNHLYISTTTGGAAGYVTGSTVNSHVITESRDNIIWRTGDQTSTNTMTLWDTGNLGLGIGSAEPSARIVVQSSDSTLASTTTASRFHSARIGINNSNTTIGTSSGITLQSQAGSNNFWFIDCIGASSYLSPLTFARRSSQSGVTEVARFDSQNNLLVGTTTSISNDHKLVVSKDSGPSYIRLQSLSLGENQSSDLAVRGVVSGQTRYATIGAFRNSAASTATGYVRLDETDGGPDFLWFDNSAVLRTSQAAANIGTGGGTIIGTQTSDERLKDIEPTFEYGLSDVMALKPIAYKRNDDQSSKRQLGFGAQSTLPIVPEAVYDTGECIDGYDAEADDAMVQTPKSDETKLAMEYVQLIPVLTKAMQEQQAMIEELKAEVAALKGA